MKNKNVKVIDEHNIDRDANVMFALELEGSEYVVYWITRDEESNNLFVSKVLKNIDDTYSMLNVDDEQKKKEIAEIVKTLISNSVSDQNDKLVGTTTTLANGKVAKFVNVSFNKEQHIDVAKTYITTVKKEVTKVAENYYDVVVEETKVETVLPAAPVVEIFPASAPAAVEAQVVAQPASVVVEPITVEQPAVVPTPVVETPVVVAPAPTQEAVVVSPVPAAQPTVAPAQPSVVAAPAPVLTTVPVVEPVKVEAPTVVPAPAPEASVAPAPVVAPQPIEAPAVILPVPEPAAVVEPAPLVFDATKETNLKNALGEVANSSTIPVENIETIREFGVEAPVVSGPASAPAVDAPAIAPMVQPQMSTDPKSLTLNKKAGFANSKFFMVVAVAFFLASCVFLGYEVYNYFQLVK